MNKLSLKEMSRQSIIAAIYVVATLSVGGIASGPIQFRYSEILNFLAFFNPVNAIGVTLGVFISNFWSTLGSVDLIFGTLHTAISLYFISKSKNLFIASLCPTIFAFIIGFELSFIAGFGNMWIMTLQVMISELIIMTIGYIIMLFLRKNKSFLKSIGSYRHNIDKFK